MSESRDKKTQVPRQDDRVSVVEINDKLLGIDIIKSREVLPLPNITPVPNTPEFIIGVFNLRGDIFPVLDLSALLGLGAKKIRSSDMVMVLDDGQITVGVLVDRIHGVKSLDGVKVEAPKGIVSKQMQEYVTGVVADKSSEIYLLDIDQLFQSPVFRANS